ncbi:MAG: MFS transporter [Clostridia bacterium]|nr:MFS transporter [Clostridia bacterium]
MNKLKQMLSTYRNDGTDPRKNDAWRVLLFSLNYAGGAAITIMMGKWSYYTQNVLQLGIMFASIHLPIRILDAITDPLIANMFDKYNKPGKFKLFMILGALLSFFPAMIVFFYPVNPDIPLSVSFLLLGLCYAIIIIGNTILMTATRAGQAIITQDPKQRPLYALGQTVSDALVSAFVSVVVTSNLIGSMQEPFVWRISIIVMSVVSIIFVLLAAKAISNRDNPTYYSMNQKKREETKITEFFSLIKRSKPLRSLLWATCSDSIAKSVRASLSIYLFANIIMNRGLTSAFDILNGVVLGAPVLVIGMYFASKKGSAKVYHNVSLIQTLVSVAGFFITMFLLPADPEYTYSGITFSVIMVILVFGFYMSTLGISTNLENAMVGDLTDYEYLQSGKFIPGTIGAALTFVNKVASSGVGLITMGIMAFCGFSGSGADAVVPENVFVNYRFYYCVLASVFLLPALGHFITYISMKKYPLTDEVMQEVSMKIAKERGLIEDDAKEVTSE